MLKGNSWVFITSLKKLFDNRQGFERLLYLLFGAMVLVILLFFEGGEKNKLLGYLFFALTVPYSLFILVRGIIYKEFPSEPKPICMKDSELKYYTWMGFYLLVSSFLIIAFFNLI